jgi:hypothetical protein
MAKGMFDGMTQEELAEMLDDLRKLGLVRTELDADGALLYFPVDLGEPS